MSSWAPEITPDCAGAGYRVIFLHGFDCSPYLRGAAARHPGIILNQLGDTTVFHRGFRQRRKGP